MYTPRPAPTGKSVVPFVTGEQVVTSVDLATVIFRAAADYTEAQESNSDGGDFTSPAENSGHTSSTQSDTAQREQA